MNAFFEHHKDNIRPSYRCFDRIAVSSPFGWRQDARAPRSADVIGAPDGRHDEFVDP